MPRKTLRVQVELDIQAVTCPGVWLCPNGKVSLQVFLLDSCIQTTGLQPIFPLLYHEKFIFYKNFYSAFSLSELQRFIKKEHLYAELVQWKNCETGNVIASFQTSLFDVLYPTSYEGALAGVDVDLLMEPSKNFPGIIAPKIEISTRTTVEEILCSDEYSKESSYVVNPKTVTSDLCPCGPRRQQSHQQRVCHSVGYHKSRRCSKIQRSGKPPFVCRKVDEELINRKPGLSGDPTKKCKCCLCSDGSNALLGNKECYSMPSSGKTCVQDRTSDEVVTHCSKPIRKKSKTLQKYSKKGKMCSCGSGHEQENCSVCSKYRYYFEDNTCECDTPNMRSKRSSGRDSFVRKVTTCSPVRDRDKHISRYPMKTVGKEYDHQPQKLRCGCSPLRTTNSDQELRACDCFNTKCEDKNNGRTYNCPAQKRPSLAEQIHQRLSRTLDCVPTYSVQCTHDFNSGSESLCSCSKMGKCKDGFYKNLGKFYKNLRRC